MLPPPISTNNLFRNIAGRGRVATTDYKAWKVEADHMLSLQRRPRFTVPVFISLMLGEVGVGNMDSDNAAKAAIDCLKRAEVIVDDSRRWVRSSRSTWVPGFRGIVAIVAPAVEPVTAEELRRTIPSSLWDTMQGHAKKLPR